MCIHKLQIFICHRIFDDNNSTTDVLNLISDRNVLKNSGFLICTHQKFQEISDMYMSEIVN
jgi:hypothetical protein